MPNNFNTSRQEENQGLLNRLQMSGPKRILALDGGGIRGALCLGILEKVEAELSQRYGNVNFCLADYYDMIGGTSTGAIIATCLATGMKVSAVKDLYLQMGESIFSEKVNIFPKFIQMIFNKARYKENRLEEALANAFQQKTFSSSDIKTGLCIIAKRADTFSSWIFHNHPLGKYHELNSGILLKDLLRATSAAPSYFSPVSLHIGNNEEGVFVDGGVSSYNNPALIMFYLCSLPHLPYQWNTGKDELLITSVGTGFSKPKKKKEQLMNRKIVSWAGDIPDLFMTDATTLNQMILQSMAYTPTPQIINSEFGDLKGVNIVKDPLFSYLRYNVSLEKNALQAIMQKAYSVEEVEDLIEMSNGYNAKKLYEIGRSFAKDKVEVGHFAKAFDMLYHTEKKSILTQDKAIEVCAWLKDKGKHYKKYKAVYARKVESEEKVTSITASGIETQNTAMPGDYIVKNQTEASEQYVVKSDKFTQRYVFSRKHDTLWDEYAPIGEIYGKQLTKEVLAEKGWPPHFYIDAAWEKAQYCAMGDYLACPLDGTEFYRIGRLEFEQTYIEKN